MNLLPPGQNDTGNPRASPRKRRSLNRAHRAGSNTAHRRARARVLPALSLGEAGGLYNLVRTSTESTNRERNHPDFLCRFLHKSHSYYYWRNYYRYWSMKKQRRRNLNSYLDVRISKPPPQGSFFEIASDEPECSIGKKFKLLHAILRPAISTHFAQIPIITRATSSMSMGLECI